MSKKLALPDSLELLLDTMCNTFGGIMFIAISLVVVSQLISRDQLAKTPEEINETNLQNIRQHITELQNDILELQKFALARQFASTSQSPEQEAAISELQQAKIASLNAADALERSSIRREAEQLKLAHQKKLLAQAQQALEAKRKAIAANKDRLEHQQKVLRDTISELEKTLSTLQPREIRFAMEVSTNREPYWVLLQNGRIFRYGASGAQVFGEVEQRDSPDGDFGRMIPRKGNSIGDDPATQLDTLFKNVDRKKYFVSLLIDNTSFASLLTLKQYLRNAGFMVNWNYNPNYEFQYVSHASYKASE